MNLKSAFSSFASIILGALLVFMSILAFRFGGGAFIAYGIVALLVGLLYIAVSLLRMFSINDNKGVLEKITALTLSLGFLVYYLTYVIIQIVNIGGANLGALGWIINVSIMIGIVGAITFEILGMFLGNELFKRLKSIFIFVFIAFVLVNFVFPNGMNLATIADITLFEAITLICYCSLVLGDLKLQGEPKKEEPKKEEPKQIEDNAEPNKEEA